MGVVSILHRLHEQTDDKNGLPQHFRALRALLQNLQVRSRSTQRSDVLVQKPSVLLCEEAPPTDAPETIRARLLEVILILLMVPHMEEGDAAARKLFLDFAQEVQESSR